MMKNRTYRNFMTIMKRIMAKGYDKEEAERLTRNIFDEFEACPMGMSIEAREKQILSRKEWEAECRMAERMWG